MARGGYVKCLPWELNPDWTRSERVASAVGLGRHGEPSAGIEPTLAAYETAVLPIKR